LEGSASNEKFDLAKTYSCPKKGVHYMCYPIDYIVIREL